MGIGVGIGLNRRGAGDGVFLNTFSTLFDGVDELVNVGDDSSLYPGTGDMSYSIWFKPTILSSFRSLFGPSDIATGVKGVTINTRDDELNLFMSVGVGGQWGVNTGGVTGGASFTSSGAGLVTGTWFHVVMTLDRDGDAVMYLDGSVLATAAMNPNDFSGVDIININDYQIGDSVDFFGGNIDEVSVFSSLLTPGDVTELFNGGTPNNVLTHSASSSLVSYYRMGDGDTFPTILDNKGSNDGTMINMESSDFVLDTPP